MVFCHDFSTLPIQELISKMNQFLEVEFSKTILFSYLHENLSMKILQNKFIYMYLRKENFPSQYVFPIYIEISSMKIF